MTNKEITVELQRQREKIVEHAILIDKLQSKCHSHRESVPTKGEVLGWVKREAYRKKKVRREQFIAGTIIAVGTVLCILGVWKVLEWISMLPVWS